MFDAAISRIISAGLPAIIARQAIGTSAFRYDGCSGSATSVTDFYSLGSCRLGITVDFQERNEPCKIRIAFVFNGNKCCYAAVNFLRQHKDGGWSVTGGVGEGGLDGPGGKHLAAISEKIGVEPSAMPKAIGDDKTACLRMGFVANYVRRLAAREQKVMAAASVEA